MTDLDEILEEEAIFRHRIEKNAENGPKTGIPKRTQGFFETQTAELGKLWARYNDIDLEIRKCIKKEKKKEKCAYIEEDLFGYTETKYFEYNAFLLDGLRKLQNPVIPRLDTALTNAANEAQMNEARVCYQELALPKINIPKYNGDYETWRSFHDLFVSLVHTNQRLTPVQKFFHLKSCLVGEAEKLIRHTPITEADYEPAWEKLKKRFENKKLLVSHQLKLLTNQPKITIEKIKDIKTLVDTTNECLQQLKSLDVDTNSWDVLLVHILIQKVPYLTVRLWEEKQGTSQDLPKFCDFMQFLQQRINILEAVSDSVTSNSTLTKAPPRATLTHLATNGNKCPACNQGHYVVFCQKYRRLPANDKLKVITSAGRCINCLSNQHLAKVCSSRHRCSKCQEKHHTTLHDACQHHGQSSYQKQPEARQNPRSRVHSANNNQMGTTTNNLSGAAAAGDYQKGNAPNIRSPVINGSESLNTAQAFITRQDRHTLLSTALVRAYQDNTESQILRCLIDTGSQSSFITEDACQRLKASWRRTATTITGLNTSQAALATRQTTLNLQSCVSEDTVIKEDFFIINQITDTLPSRMMERVNYNHLQGLTLADPNYWQPGKIDALLGAQVFARIIQEGVRRGQATSPVAVQTLFGWILLGSTNERKPHKVAAFTVTTGDVNIETQLKRFWEIEESTPTRIHTKEDTECQHIYETTTRRLSNGRYQVQLPFVNNVTPTLGHSREQALKRFLQLNKKFTTNPTLEKEYTKCVNEYLELEQMEMVEPPSEGTPAYYIPHHAVFKESTTTKLRVVFDASAKTTNGHSLNEFLLKGPTLQPKLFSTLLNWRKYRIALIADIEKMYRMIDICPDHRTYQRIIWFHPITKNIQDFQLKTVTFGTSAAPYLAIRTLQQLANDEKNKWPRAAEAVHTSFYVDDVLTGADSIKEAEILQTELIELMEAGGFKLRKWSSNDSRLLKRIPVDYREPRSEKCFAEDESIKTLGIQWHPAQDHFAFKVSAASGQTTITKRIILSEISRLYDPLGWLAPVLIKGKILMQLLWITGKNWDECVPENIEQQWKNFKDDLQNVERITIPRWIQYSPQYKIQIHGFCDASEKAYAAVIYIRIQLSTNAIVSHLLTAKTRVAPVKPTTIPRLELNGALLLARLMKTTIEEMQLKDIPIFAWTDSTIVLQWIQDHPSRWKTYVANRVAEIQEVIKFDQWRHVPTKMNPADLASRGIAAAHLVDQTLWWHGPQWLTKDLTEWPTSQTKLGHTRHEERAAKIMNLMSIVENELLSRYSSFKKLIRITALIRRFMYNCMNTTNRYTHQLSCIELQNAENVILKVLQKITFPQEYSALMKGKLIPRASRLIKLNPFLDKHGILRVGGRLENAPLAYNRKHPIVLPQSHHITSLIINKAHNDTLHGGTALMINTIRDKYWILNLRRAITTTVHKCIKCARQRAKFTSQLMGNLPESRLEITRAFLKVGVDYAGPVTIKTSTLRSAKLQKAYICIFVCMSTRAVHIELVSDLTSEAFLAALRRFVARRGICTDLYSDCGTNFVGANKLLQHEHNKLKQVQQESAAIFCSDHGIIWHFNPPSSPHFGGLWEAGIKSIKYHLRRVLGNTICTFEEYSTVLTQIESCLNSRPICYIPNDPNDPFILTPGHFLIGQSLNAIPNNEAIDTSTRPSQRWKFLQHLNKQFWDRWANDYLNQLQNRPKWQVKQQNLQIGDIVLLKSEQTHPTVWPLAIVETVFPGQDGLVRVVQLRTQNGVFKRPVAKLCRLPVDQF